MNPFETFELHTPQWARIADIEADPLETPTRLAVEWDGNLFVEREFPSGQIVGYGSMEGLR